MKGSSYRNNEHSVRVGTPNESTQNKTVKNEVEKPLDDKTAKPNLSWNTLVSIVNSRKMNIPAEPQPIFVNPEYITPKALTTPKIKSKKKRSRSRKRNYETEYQYDSEEYIIIEEEEESEEDSGVVSHF